MKSMGVETYIDNIKVKSLVKNTKVSLGSSNKGYYEKVIVTEEPFRRGSIIDYQDDRYIILSDAREKKYNKYHKGIMRLTNELIHFELDSKNYLFPSAIETEGMSLKTFNGGVLTLANGNMVVNLQDNILTQKIKIEKMFVAMGTGWEVIGIDKSFAGLIKLHCSKTTVPSELFNPPSNSIEYPSRDEKPIVPEVPINFTVTIDGNAEVKVSATTKYNAIVNKNGEVVEDKEIMWEVKQSNGQPSLSTIDQSGLLNAGRTKEDIKITVKLVDNPNVYFEMVVSVFDPDAWDW